jgi:hypothetical protein
MSNQELDDEAPLPYVRSIKDDIEASKVKFVYEKAKTSIRKATRKSDDGKTISTFTEEITDVREVKVYLKTFGQTTKEDRESFFECFEYLQDELKAEWNDVSQNKSNDAKVLFDAMDHMLTGTANAEWKDVLTKQQFQNKIDFETFKLATAEFICTKILPEDAYNRQVTYLRERVKPMGISVKQWWQRMQTLNRYLPYFFKTKEDLQREVTDVNVSIIHLWKRGSLDGPELKRIVTGKCPSQWTKELKRHDIGHTFRNTKTTDDLVDYFTMLESLEKSGRMRARQGPRGRMGNACGAGRFQYYTRPVMSNYNNPRQPIRQQYGYAQGSAEPSQRPAGQGYYQNRYQGRQSMNVPMSRPGSNYYIQGGRGGRNSAPPGRTDGRFGGQRSGRGRFPSRGGFQGQQFRGGYQKSSNAFYQEQTEALEENIQEEEGQNEEQLYNMSEEELCQYWNENLFLDAPPISEEEIEDEDNHYAEGEVETDEYYEAEQYAAEEEDGSWCL